MATALVLIVVGIALVLRAGKLSAAAADIQLRNAPATPGADGLGGPTVGAGGNGAGGGGGGVW